MKIQRRIFDKNILTLIIPEVSGDIEAEGLTLPIPDISPVKKDITVLGKTLKFGATITAGAEVLAQGKGAKIFEDSADPGDADRNFTPSGVDLLARLELGVDASLSGSADIPTGTQLLEASVKGALSAGFFYRHWTLARIGEPKVDALRRLAGIALPNLVDPSKLKDEAHAMGFKYNLDLGLKLNFGYQQKFSFERKLLGEMFDRVALKADVLATLEAALGFSLFERLQLTVGDLGVDQNRVRLRIYRERKKELSFGVVFHLMVSYDLGSSLIAILDQALELEPVKEIRGYIDEFAKAAKAVGDGDWDQITKDLGEKAQAFLLEALPLDELANKEEVKRVAALAQKIIDEYDGLEGRLSSLWDRILTEANLQPDSEIRQALTRIRDLDVSGLDKALDGILGEDFAKALDLLETLTGKSLEELVVDQADALSLVKKARSLAEKALGFLDDAPQELLNAWQKYARKWGVQRVVDWIRENATSPKKIRDAAEGEIKQAIEKLLGKAVAKIQSMDDVHSLQNWASRVAEKLENLQNFDQTLRRNFKKLIGEQGVNLSLQVDHMTRKTQLLDIDFDPRDKGMQKAWENLATLDVKGFLADLPEDDDDQEDLPAELPFRIRESLFTNTRSRSSALSLLLSGFFNLEKKVTRRQLTQSSVRLLQAGGGVQRRAAYSGAMYLETAFKSDMKWMGGVSLDCEARGEGADLDAPYHGDAAFSFKLTTTREDPRTSRQELAGISSLLAALGFQMARPVEASVPADAETKLALDWVLDKDAVALFFQDLAAWDEESLDFNRSVYVNAGQRWLATTLVSKEIQSDVEANSLLPALLFMPEYRQFWKKSYQEYRDRGNYLVNFLGKKVEVNVAGSAYPTTRLLLKSKKGPRALSRAVGSLDLKDALRHKDLWKLMAGFARASKVASPEAWESPLFMLWLITKRLDFSGTGFDYLQHARGLATLRFREAGGEWEPPLSFRAG